MKLMKNLYPAIHLELAPFHISSLCYQLQSTERTCRCYCSFKTLLMLLFKQNIVINTLLLSSTGHDKSVIDYPTYSKLWNWSHTTKVMHPFAANKVPLKCIFALESAAVLADFSFLMMWSMKNCWIDNDYHWIIKCLIWKHMGGIKCTVKSTVQYLVSCIF